MRQGTIQNRDAFLGKLANRLGRDRRTQVEKPIWSNRPQFDVFNGLSQDELVEKLTEHCKKIHTNVVETTIDHLSESLAEAIDDFGGGSIVTWNDQRFEQFGLSNFIAADLPKKEMDVHIWDTSIGKENLKIAERANIGITFSDITLAESGTVVLLSDNGKGRSVSLLPATYIAIIPKSTIVPRMTQATMIIQERIDSGELVPSCVNFISGPSNSADIEMNLIVGVHGPIQATYIIVNDR